MKTNMLNLLAFLTMICFHFTLIYSEKIPLECKNATYEISSLISDINDCLIMNSLTGNTCIKCVKKYLDLVEYRERLIKNETKCIKIFSEIDKYQTIDVLIDNVTMSWSGLNCDKCFDKKQPFVYSDKMTNFIGNYDHFMNCITNYTDTERQVCNKLELDYVSNSTNSTVCEKCKSKYQSMYKSYLTLKMSDRSMSVCGDIENLLVCTKNIFETRLHCAHNHLDNLIVMTNIWPVLVMLACSMLFYTCTKLGLRNKPHFEIYQQKRVAPASEICQSLRSNFVGGVVGYNNNTSESDFDFHDRFNGSTASTNSNTEQRPNMSNSNATISQLAAQNPVSYNYSTIHKNNRQRYVKEDIPIVVDVPIRIYDTFTYQFDGNYK